MDKEKDSIQDWIDDELALVKKVYDDVTTILKDSGDDDVTNWLIFRQKMEIKLKNAEIDRMSNIIEVLIRHMHDNNISVPRISRIR